VDRKNWAVLAAPLAVALMAPPQARADGSCGAWQTDVSPNPGAAGNALVAVAGGPGRESWAVGAMTAAAGDSGGPVSDLVQWPLALRDTGKGWVAENVPVTGPAALFGVTVTGTFTGVPSPGDTWVVGAYGTGSSRTPLALRHRNGAWDLEAFADDPDAMIRGTLVDVAVAGPDDVWMVGIHGSPGDRAATRALAMHWDGTALRRVPFPAEPTRDHALAAVSATGPADVWAVGRSLAPAESLDGGRGHIYHWDGQGWSPVKVGPKAASSALHDVVAISPSDVWAVGHLDGKPLFLHWDGADWRRVAAPASAVPVSVSALSGDDVWAATADGYLHWDGQAWSTVDAPGPLAAKLSSRAAIAVRGACDVVAVGSSLAEGGSQTLVERVGVGVPDFTPATTKPAPAPPTKPEVSGDSVPPPPADADTVPAPRLRSLRTHGRGRTR
jgi:hypothetical protein